MNQNKGRPEDTQIETLFMSKLREGKIQLLNSESDYTILLKKVYSFHPDFPPQSPKRGPPRPNIERNPFREIKERILYFEIGELPQNIKNKLIVVFEKLHERWKFEEFEDAFPEYLFDDGSDLSYIIDGVQKDEPEIIQNFTAETLIFLMFLCLGYAPLYLEKERCSMNSQSNFLR